MMWGQEVDWGEVYEVSDNIACLLPQLFEKDCGRELAFRTQSTSSF